MLFKWLILAAFVSVAWAAKCEDGVDNVIKFTDTTKGKGQIIFTDFEVTTYDENKEPSCRKGQAQFRLPGHFKLHKGFVTVNKPITDETDLELALNVEKDSWMIGKVCVNGKSENSFVPDQLCKFQLCSLAPTVCSLLKVKSSGPIDVTPFVQKEPIDIGALPIPQLGGDWKIGGKIIQNGKTLAGVQIGNGKTWLNIYSEEAKGGSVNYDPVPPGQPNFDHNEL
ncbi:Protein CBR-DCT-18 [Caenorhabditis briggsae]|uniref:Uncharacterized protein n=4 Tax=Caenorhabditis TaxID=6237 RepID=A0AAE9DL22_CAEBR|nr:Protein CBR-DCT-18 [Caenorhabditis briggsae]PIC46274.1 hypothetical protein B9Z55_006021 [Caenorhabditis nigoni]ULU06374.1 hypothetical protein L3Y34_018319 [Caenorhabditis briggsae]UMM18330.1 hypothetical protein L5515_014445 [Caenorhabditis briggsae]CAP23819.1 Protein CBR-DCT-18 [Caenorhabditis briggsae]